jgi:peptidoglycan/xylan/chitin deacetylase (PgdA/CDA1 family)
VNLALTYDDGPNHPYTLDLLDVLAKHDVHATFFMVGRFVQERPDIAKHVSEAGHLVANHSMTHPQLPKLAPAEIASEIDECERMLAEHVGAHSRLFRPPFVLTNPAIEKIVASRGLTTVMWKAAGSDWRLEGVASIVDKVHSELGSSGGIILLHDGGHLGIGARRDETVKATDIMIARYKSEGCKFVSPLEA